MFSFLWSAAAKLATKIDQATAEATAQEISGEAEREPETVDPEPEVAAAPPRSVAQIGEGTYGRVMCVNHPQYGLIAEKQYLHDVDVSFMDTHFATCLNHPHILKAFKVVNDPIEPYKQRIYMPFVHQREITDLKKFAYGLIEAVEHLHRHGIIHMDITSKNVLVGESNYPLLIDFSLTQYDFCLRYSAAVTWPADKYRAPETYVKKDCDPRATDVYSLGKTLHRLADQHSETLNNSPEETLKLYQLFGRMQSADPAARPTAAECLLDDVFECMIHIPVVEHLPTSFMDKRVAQVPIFERLRSALLIEQIIKDTKVPCPYECLVIALGMLDRLFAKKTYRYLVLDAMSVAYIACVFVTERAPRLSVYFNEGGFKPEVFLDVMRANLEVLRWDVRSDNSFLNSHPPFVVRLVLLTGWMYYRFPTTQEHCQFEEWPEHIRNQGVIEWCEKQINDCEF